MAAVIVLHSIQNVECEVATLVNEGLKPGAYKITWDATGYPASVYFYRLQIIHIDQEREAS